MVRDRKGDCPHFPSSMKDKLNKTFNEIQEIENNNYSTEYQELDLADEYQAADEVLDSNHEENKIEEEPEEDKMNGHLDEEELKKDNIQTDEMWKGDDHDDEYEEKIEEEEKEFVNSAENEKLIDAALRHENTSLE